MNVVLFGPPGAGKGTQGALLADRRGLLKISTGDILRDAARAGTPLGLAAKHYMDAGELVPDAVILDLVREVLDCAPNAKGFLLDGFPRTIPQAKGVDEMLAQIGKPIDAVIVLDVTDEALIKRLSGRRTCSKCGAVFNVYFDPPENPEVCESCGAPLVQRDDDRRETVVRRLDVYRQQTAPIIDYYERQEVPLHHVDGERSIEDVQEAISRIVDP